VRHAARRAQRGSARAPQDPRRAQRRGAAAEPFDVACHAVRPGHAPGHARRVMPRRGLLALRLSTRQWRPALPAWTGLPSPTGSPSPSGSNQPARSMIPNRSTMRTGRTAARV